MNRLLLLAFLFLPGCGNLTFTVGLSSGSQELTATTVHEESGAGGNKVAIIDVSGMILNGNKPGLLSQGENPVAVLHEQLHIAQNDSDVKAVILRINSPGGTVTATDIMYREVLRFKEQSKKPVVVLQMDIAASGGYYLSCAGDWVVAYPSTITGSIGVIIQTISFKPAMDRWGIAAEALTSGKNKAAGSPFGTLTDEHRAVLQELVQDFYKRFTSTVRAARPRIPADRFADVTDGRVFSGEDALALGLVDELGDLYNAHAKAKSLANIAAADMVIYHRPLNYVASPYATAPSGQPSASGGAGNGATQVNIMQFNLPEMPGGASVGFYYMWQP
jgi:protease-4